MLTKTAGKFRKFRSSGAVGGETWTRSRPARVLSDKEQIVLKLRERAEKHELAGETATVNKAIVHNKIAEELRSCAVSIRLNDWNDMDEL